MKFGLRCLDKLICKIPSHQVLKSSSPFRYKTNLTPHSHTPHYQGTKTYTPTHSHVLTFWALPKSWTFVASSVDNDFGYYHCPIQLKHQSDYNKSSALPSDETSITRYKNLICLYPCDHTLGANCKLDFNVLYASFYI